MACSAHHVGGNSPSALVSKHVVHAKLKLRIKASLDAFPASLDQVRCDGPGPPMHSNIYIYMGVESRPLSPRCAHTHTHTHVYIFTYDALISPVWDVQQLRCACVHRGLLVQLRLSILWAGDFENCARNCIVKRQRNPGFVFSTFNVLFDFSALFP